MAKLNGAYLHCNICGTIEFFELKSGRLRGMYIFACVHCCHNVTRANLDGIKIIVKEEDNDD